MTVRGFGMTVRGFGMTVEGLGMVEGVVGMAVEKAVGTTTWGGGAKFGLWGLNSCGFGNSSELRGK